MNFNYKTDFITPHLKIQSTLHPKKWKRAVTAVKKTTAILNANIIRHFMTDEGMLERGIEPNDLLLIDPNLPPKHLSIVAYEIDDEFKLRRFYQDHDGMFLIPHNALILPIDLGKVRNKKYLGRLVAHMKTEPQSR